MLSHAFEWDEWLLNELQTAIWRTDSTVADNRYRVFTRSSKRPALHLLEVCWTFAGSCRHPIRVRLVMHDCTAELLALYTTLGTTADIRSTSATTMEKNNPSWSASKSVLNKLQHHTFLAQYGWWPYPRHGLNRLHDEDFYKWWKDGPIRTFFKTT